MAKTDEANVEEASAASIPVVEATGAEWPDDVNRADDAG
jgi:hypothetical protein